MTGIHHLEMFALGAVFTLSLGWAIFKRYRALRDYDHTEPEELPVEAVCEAPDEECETFYTRSGKISPQSEAKSAPPKPEASVSHAVSAEETPLTALDAEIVKIRQKSQMFGAPGLAQQLADFSKVADRESLEILSNFREAISQLDQANEEARLSSFESHGQTHWRRGTLKVISN